MSSNKKMAVTFSVAVGKWKSQTWYLVNVSFFKGNPIHRSLFFSGYLTNGVPGSYNCFVPLNGGIEEVRVYPCFETLEVLREVDTK